MAKRNIQSKLTIDQKQEIINRYIAGEGSTKISKDFDMSSDTIRRIVKNFGVKLKVCGTRCPRFKNNELIGIVDRYENNESIESIAKFYKTSHKTINKAIAKLGIRKRDKKLVKNSGRFQKGQIPHNKKEPIEKICPKCNQSFYVKPSLDRVKHCSKKCSRIGRPSGQKGKSPSIKTREKMSKAKLGIRGPDHWNFKHGIRRGKSQMSTGDYQEWRKEIFKLDNYTCQYCLMKGQYLEAHHIKSYSKYPELRLDINNGITLCEKCHCRVDFHRAKFGVKNG